MEKVPVMISTKDLSYLEDMFQWNFIVCKKAKNFSEYVLDEEIKKELEKVFKMHESICRDILKILK